MAEIWCGICGALGRPMNTKGICGFCDVAPEPSAKCDGDHALSTPCSDPNCWHTDPSDATVAAIEQVTEMNLQVQSGTWKESYEHCLRQLGAIDALRIKAERELREARAITMQLVKQHFISDAELGLAIEEARKEINGNKAN